MALAILKILTDTAWYISFIAPLADAAPSLIRGILLAIPVLWAIYVAVSWKKRDFLADTQGMVLFEARFLLCISLLELVFVGPSKWQELCGRASVLFIILGIFLLRASRIADIPGKTRRFWGNSSVSMISVFILAVILTSKTVRNRVLWLLRTAYNRLIVPILEAIFWVIVRILSAIVSFFQLFFSGTNQEEEQEVLLTDISNPLNLDEVDTTQLPLAVKIIGYVLLALVVAAILYYIYRKLSGNASRWGNAVHGSITRSNDDKNQAKSQNRRFFGQDRNVRYYYKKVLRLCAGQGLDLERPVTSEDVNEFASSYLGKNEESAELTHLYQAVRYGEKSESSEQTARAREIYKNWK